jgi:hypothetical protein
VVVAHLSHWDNQNKRVSEIAKRHLHHVEAVREAIRLKLERATLWSVKNKNNMVQKKYAFFLSGKVNAQKT